MEDFPEEVDNGKKKFKWHFVVHNQGLYDPIKKDNLLELLRSKYKDKLEGYLIAQEIYTHDRKDTHLQGNLFFKNGVYKNSLLKLFKTLYKEQKTDKGLKFRTQIMAVKSEGRAYNYMMNPNKDGGDSDVICDNSALDKRRANQKFSNDLAQVMYDTYMILDRVKHDRTVWSDDHEYTPYEPPTLTFKDFILR